ncbi:hypothetical protein F2P79_022265 [Pimephales promelas]|nr:hypothetical protein F2P79_022265 [Pimephales promelas]
MRCGILSKEHVMFLPSYEGPYFVMGHLDDLVYWIQKSPRAKVKVIQHDQLKASRSREPLDNAWVLDQSQNWTPSEIMPPAVDGHPADREDLGLHSLYSTALGDGPFWLSAPPATNSHIIGSLPPTPSHVILDHWWGCGGRATTPVSARTSAPTSVPGTAPVWGLAKEPVRGRENWFQSGTNSLLD